MTRIRKADVELSASKPVTLLVNPDGIPSPLIERNQWVGWCWRKDQRGRHTKVPINVRTGANASSTDPTTWATFAEALAAYHRGDVDGIGLVFSVDDPFVGVDRDDSLDQATEQLNDWAAADVALLDSYCEISVSGTGVKLFLVGNLPGDDHKKGHFEAYSSKRFFTVTGQRLAGTPATINERQPQLDQWYRKVFGERKPQSAIGTFHGMNYVRFSDLTDDEILARAAKAKNREKFLALWAGSVHPYPSQSEADMALLGILVFYTGPDPERLARLFGQSGLGQRSKWASRPDYQLRTLAKVLKGKTEFYKPNGGRVYVGSR